MAAGGRAIVGLTGANLGRAALGAVVGLTGLGVAIGTGCGLGAVGCISGCG